MGNNRRNKLLFVKDSGRFACCLFYSERRCYYDHDLHPTLQAGGGTEYRPNDVRWSSFFVVIKNIINRVVICHNTSRQINNSFFIIIILLNTIYFRQI